MGANPSILIRIAANSEELRKNLKEDKALIETTAAQMNRLVTSFQGEKLVQHANNVTAAIHKVGISTLTTAEAGRQLDVLNKAMEKMLKTSEPIPPLMMKTAAELRRVVTVSEHADKTVASLSANYRQFDGILQSLGINIGPYVKGLEDVMAFAKGGVAALGPFGVAAAVVGTALASWKLGEQIGEVTGWTKAIADGTAVLRGYGDIQQQEMLAKMQSIELHGHAETMWKRQTEQTDAAATAAKAHTEEMQREGMVTAGNTGHMAALANQLADLKKKREDDAKATFAASQAQSIFRSEAHFTTEVIVEQTKAIDDRMKKLAQEEAVRKKAVKDFMEAPTLNDRNNESTSFGVTAMSKTELKNLNTKYDPFGKGGNSGAEARLKELIAREGTYAPKSRDQYLTMLSDTLELARLRMTLPGFANGVNNFSGGMAVVGERGPEVVNLPGGSSVTPNHKLGGNVTIAINIQGSVLSTAAQLREAVSAALLDVYRSTGTLPAGM